MPTPKTERDWEIESDWNTLVRAQEIIADKPRHKRALEYGKKEKKRINNVLGDAVDAAKR